MRKLSSSPPFVFDNDCLASFLWVRRIDVLHALFGNQVAVPQVVMDEFRYLGGTRSEWVLGSLLAETASGRLAVIDIPAADPAAQEFLRLVRGEGTRPLGRGEAAVLAWVRFHGGTVASNNLRDVADYCARHGLGLISTDDILCLACEKGVATGQEASRLWNEMKARKRRLPDYDFGEALRRFREGLPK